MGSVNQIFVNRNSEEPLREIDTKGTLNIFRLTTC